MSEFHLLSTHSTNSDDDISFICCADSPFFISTNQNRVLLKLCKYWIHNIFIVPTVWMHSLRSELSTVIRRDYIASFCCAKLLSAESSDCYCVLGRAQNCMSWDVYWIYWLFLSFFEVHATVHRDTFPYNKPTRCINF